jgi:hypothetical protein
MSTQIHWNAQNQFLCFVIQVKGPFDNVSLEFFKRIGIRIGHDKLSLSIYQPFSQLLNVGARSLHSQVWQPLISGISQPHRLNIACDNVCKLLALCQVVVLNRCLKSVWKGFFEYPEQLRALDYYLRYHFGRKGLDVFLCAFDRLVDRCRMG